MTRRLISLNVPEPYLEALDGLKSEYGWSRTGAITVAVKRLIQDDIRMENLKLSRKERLFYNV